MQQNQRVGGDGYFADTEERLSIAGTNETWVEEKISRNVMKICASEQNRIKAQCSCQFCGSFKACLIAKLQLFGSAFTEGQPNWLFDTFKLSFGRHMVDLADPLL